MLLAAIPASIGRVTATAAAATPASAAGAAFTTFVRRSCAPARTPLAFCGRSDPQKRRRPPRAAATRRPGAADRCRPAGERRRRPPLRARPFASTRATEAVAAASDRDGGGAGATMTSPNRRPADGSVGDGAAAAAPPPSSPSSSSSTAESAAAKRVSASPASLAACGARLRSGLLVSFPTETVYGLGCHALDPDAVAGVFRAKERPLTDPLIVHVTDAGDALRLWSACSSPSPSRGDGEPSRSSSPSSIESLALHALTSAFWPGPLTVVARSSPAVPTVVTASTGYVACRAPSHPVARAVIDAAGVPVAAPSANKFGHVSPTRADHVLDDLGREDVWVVDPALAATEDDGGGGGGGGGGGAPWDHAADGAAGNGKAAEGGSEGGRICHVGVESTVAKVEMSSPSRGRVIVLRHGAVSSLDLRRALDSAGLSPNFDVSSPVRSTTPDGVASVAPGQTVRHYSPDVVSYVIAHARYGNGAGVSDVTDEERALLRGAVVVDLGGRLEPLRRHALAYRDLSPSGDSAEAAASVFEALRWAEDVEGAERVYFPEVVVPEGSRDVRGEADYMEEDALARAVKDRLTRAASGEMIETLR